jgi:hypothetical protein
LKVIERGEWNVLREVSVMSEKKTDSSFCWEATLKPRRKSGEDGGALVSEGYGRKAVAGLRKRRAISR